MRLADGVDDEVGTGRQPVIVWINGAGWRECDKLLMSAEMEFLAEAGFALAFIQYRHSGLGVFPTQLQDCKTAVRFLRAHADEYGLDPERVGVIGRSAGGHLAAWMAMNTDGFDTDEWAGYSSKVQAVVDLFGPADIAACTRINLERVKEPGYRWDRMSVTHEGAFLGITDDMTEGEMLELGRKASPVHAINDGMCPITILHGDQDPLVPIAISEDFYARLVEAGLEDRADLYIVKNGGHGTREFFQPAVKAIIEKSFRASLG
jgi:acetyl esterase/lipase